MESKLQRQVAETLEVEVELLVLIPDLLRDLDELGSSAEDIIEVLRGVGFQPRSTLLDLGCGKGVASVAAAAELGARVEGVDAMPAFIEAANVRAHEMGVSERCHFRVGDLNVEVDRESTFDGVMLLSVGPIFGNHERTVGMLRRLVRPGGLIAIDDGYLPDDVEAPETYVAYGNRQQTHRRLTAFGDRLIHEELGSKEEELESNQSNTRKIRRRAEALKIQYPHLSGALDQFVRRQEEETEFLHEEFVSATWVLRRATD